MKSSLYLVAASAVLATAGPLNKRAMETDWVTDVVTVTVTAEPVKPTAFVENSKPKPPQTTAAPPPPPPAKPAPKPAPKPVAAAAAEKPKPPPPPPKVETPKPKPVVVQAPPKPSPQTPAPSAPGASNDYQRVVLEQHNLHRSNHSAGALTWDDDLAAQAMAWAQGCKFEHNRSGQNLASAGTTNGLGSKSEAAAKGITNMWYNSEMSNYQFYGMSDPPSSANLGTYGHFSQLVWKNTQKCGCATVSCPAGSIFSMPAMYTVCNYEPAGNFQGQYGNNVLKPSGLKISIL